MRVEEIFLSIVSIIQQNMGFILPDACKRSQKASLLAIIVFMIILKYQTMIQPDELLSSAPIPNSSAGAVMKNENKSPNIQIIRARKPGNSAVRLCSLTEYLSRFRLHHYNVMSLRFTA